MEKQMKKNIPNDEELKKYIHKNNVFTYPGGK